MGDDARRREGSISPKGLTYSIARSGDGFRSARNILSFLEALYSKDRSHCGNL